MSLTAPRLSETELSQRILDMAKTGVYRESIFETFQSLATKRQIRNAIAQAKQFGLYSVRNLRDGDLGTYYQVDLAKYQSFQAVLKAAIPLTPGDDLAQRVVLTTQALRGMLRVASGSALALLILGGLCLVTGHLQSGRLAWMGAVSLGSVWAIQKALARSLI